MQQLDGIFCCSFFFKKKENYRHQWHQGSVLATCLEFQHSSQNKEHQVPQMEEAIDLLTLLLPLLLPYEVGTN